ncbi:hypothetical protein C5Y96_09045 [Blastopirellula marina]|uniref:Uncharacterized protein n=2 Tax=Pirellulales TaxID=2691354 RepID=A0A2S8FUD3_9BACT|nr:hypothetical protein C5Y96_09045 [Blastopirellula marina]RCS53362.1 hypothetical protein DTL36_09055 [Bremerella cremea]
MSISPLALLLLGVLFAGFVGIMILLIALAGKHGGKIAAGLGAAVLLGLMLLCSGFWMLRTSHTTVQSATTLPMEVPAYSEVEYGETVARAPIGANSARKESLVWPSVKKTVTEMSGEIDRPMPVSAESHIDSPLTPEEVTASTGKTIGQFAGSVYQEFRNQLKSGKLDLDPSKIIPPGRPSWVEQEPHWGHDQTYYVAVSSGPYDRGMDCRRALDLEISKAIDQFAVELTGSDDAPTLIGDDLATIKEAVAMESYQEELTPSFGVMHQWHSLLKFDPAIQEQIRQFWYAQQRISRVVYIGTGFLFLLGLMSIFYAGMSLTGQGSRISPALVSAGSVAALGGLIAAGVIFVRSFPML